MSMINDVLKSICDLVTDELPQVLARRYDITWKPDGSPVTEADRYLEAKIEERLRSELGDMVFIGEESFVSFEATNDKWIVILDPIDGTENFCSGLKEWGVSLTIWKAGEHHGSLLLLPELGERLISGDTLVRVPSRIVGFSSSFNSAIASGLAENREGRIMGCAVYNLYNVIRGAFARFVNPKGAKCWDLLAGLSLALEHGCQISVNDKEYRGEFLAPDKLYRVDIKR